MIWFIVVFYATEIHMEATESKTLEDDTFQST